MAVKYRDIPLGLESRAKTITDEQVVLQRIHLLLNTEPGEMFDIPRFGTPLKQLLYDGIAPELVEVIRVTIRHSIGVWMGDSVRIDGLDVRANIDKGEIQVELNLYLKEFDRNVATVETYRV